MKIGRTAFIAITLMCLSACATTARLSFQTQSAPNAPLASYTTYSWAFTRAPAGSSNPFVYERVRTALAESLSGSGFVLIDEGEPDMVIAFTLGARDRVDVRDWGPVAPYYPAYGRDYRYGWAYRYRDVDVRTVTEGSLALDVFDGETDLPVWHGIATSRFNSRGVSDEQIQAAVSGLVERFMAERSGAMGN